ncbi:MAG: phosphoserine phosphatase SerB [Pseudomonadota bacterium]
MPEDKHLLMVTVSGHDRPGITAAFTRILLVHGVELMDIEQASLQDLLGLYLLLDLGPAGQTNDSVIKDLLFEASRQGLTLNFRLLSAQDAGNHDPHNFHMLTHFGGTQGLAAISLILGEEKVNIEMIRTIDHSGLLAMELIVNAAGVEMGRVKKRLMLNSRELGFDLALQAMTAYRKNKRLIFFDMDSTLVDMEVIDEMARRRGVGREVARITEKAMRGDFDFEESLIQRVALLKGLSLGEMAEIRDAMALSQGVEEVVTTLKWLGLEIGVVTGGFDFFAQSLKERLGLDHAFANRLEAKAGKLTGRVLGEIIDAAGKARIVSQVACQRGIPMDQVVVVGDGANDALMLGQAGLGIAYNAKRRLQDAAHASLGRTGMTNLLHLLGVSEADIAEAMARQEQGCL